MGVLRLNGYVRRPSSYVRFREVPVTTGDDYGVVSNDLVPLPAPNGWLLSLIARTNPSRPVLNPPEMIQNIVELPKLLRETWKFLTHPSTSFTPKGAANTHLGIRFGWLPFIEDLRKLSELSDHVAKRAMELSQLYSGRGLRAKRSFGTDTKSVPGASSFSLAGVGRYVTAYSDTLITRRCWATIRWKPTTIPPYHPQDVRNTNYLRRVVLGLTPEGLANGLWKVIPWTWLIGWFTNIGDFTLKFSNTVPATHSKGNFMSMVTATTIPAGPVSTTADPDFNLTLGGSCFTTVRTRINASSAVVGFNMPFMDMSKLSVLASLVVQRFRLRLGR